MSNSCVDGGHEPRSCQNPEDRRHKRPVGKSWRTDETYILVRGQWYYRAVDKSGNAIDFLLRATRNKAAARRFFERAIAQHGQPDTIYLAV